MDGQPLVRFIVDDGLQPRQVRRHRRAVAAPISPSCAEEMTLRPGRQERRLRRAAATRSRSRAAASAGPSARASRPRNAWLPGLSAGSPAPSYQAASSPAARAARYDSPGRCPSTAVAACDAPQQRPARHRGRAARSAGRASSCYPDASRRRLQPARAARPPSHAAPAPPRLEERQRPRRESKNDIVIPDINVSRVHAEIRLRTQSGAWILTDLGSTNGTFVNGRQIATSRCTTATASPWAPPTSSSSLSPRTQRERRLP